MAIYLKIDGIEGDVTAKGHEKWIEVNHMNFGASRNISTSPGNTKDREATKPSISEIVIEKHTDKTSPSIFLDACVGKAKGKILIDICQTGDSINPYLQYTLNNVIISGYNISAANGNAAKAEGKQEKSRPTETISLNFDKVEMKYTPYDDKNNPGSPIPAGYDLATAQKV